MSTDLANLRARLEAAVAVDAPARPDRMTITALESLYLAHAQSRFNGRHGAKEVNTIRQAMRPLVMLYGDMEPKQVRPLHLLAARQVWVEAKIARSTIQARIQRWRKAWRWARRRELIDCDMPEIDPLPFGHTTEAEPVQPVPVGLVEQTIQHTSPIVGHMLNLMLLTGMRPGEVCDLHSSEIDRSKAIWVFQPSLHKSRWKGKVRKVFIGPKAQDILGPLLRPGWIFLTRTGKRWSEKLLYAAVRNACAKHVIPHWHPNQLRHTAGTMIRESMGLDAAQAVLGHARIETTQVYAERQMKLASEAALRFG